MEIIFFINKSYSSLPNVAEQELLMFFTITSELLLFCSIGFNSLSSSFTSLALQFCLCDFI